MTIKHYDALMNCTPSAHYGAKSPNKQQINFARQALLSGTWYKQAGQLMNFAGPPNFTYNGNYANKFYIIFPVLDAPGDDDQIRIGADVQCWDYNSIVVSGNTARWDSGAYTDFNLEAGTTQTAGEPPEGIKFFQTTEVDYDQNSDSATGTYGYAILEINDTTVAYLSAYTLPRYTEDYQDDSVGAGPFNQQYNIKNDSFNVAQPLRGCSEFGSANGSVGALVQHQNSRTGKTSNYIGSQAMCLFQWGHPAGLYCTGPGGAISQVPMFGNPVVAAVANPIEIKVRGRDLRGVASKKLTLVIVGRWDSGTNIKVTTSLGTSTYPFVGSNLTNPAIVVATDLVNFDPRVIENIEFTVGCSTTAAVVINSIAIFESNYGDEV